MSSLGMEGNPKLSWIIDSSVIDHITCCFTWFTKVRSVSHVHVSLLDQTKVLVTHVGSIKLSNDIVLRDVLYVPQFSYNLITTCKLTRDSS